MAASLLEAASEATSAGGGELNQRRNNLNKTHFLFQLALLTLNQNWRRLPCWQKNYACRQ
jgi:hypothetical protein